MDKKFLIKTSNLYFPQFGYGNLGKICSIPVLIKSENRFKFNLISDNNHLYNISLPEDSVSVKTRVVNYLNSRITLYYPVLNKGTYQILINKKEKYLNFYKSDSTSDKISYQTKSFLGSFVSIKKDLLKYCFVIEPKRKIFDNFILIVYDARSLKDDIVRISKRNRSTSIHYL